MTNLDFIIEFLSPTEKDVRLVFLGDGVEPEFKDDLTDHTAAFRKNAIVSSYKGKPRTFSFTTSQTFKGEAAKAMTESTIVVLDSHLSFQTIQCLLEDPDVDELDRMLVNHFIVDSETTACKYLLNLSQTPSNLLFKLFEEMDGAENPPNYINLGSLLALWFEFTPPDPD